MKTMYRASSVFATATFSRFGSAPGGERRLPASQVHAKTMGTTTTLCGESTLSWYKFWDLAFASVLDDRCPQCAMALDERLDPGSGGSPSLR